MSHFHQRKEKDCLNCNAEVVGRYCHICGQENVAPKQSLGHLLSHFFNDITHFDGKFFSTLGYLIRRPGLLTAEYVRGRRMSFLDPIRMYIFTSALFFIIFFRISLQHLEGKHEALPTTGEVTAMTDVELHAYTAKAFKDSLMPRSTAIATTERKHQQDSIRKAKGLKITTDTAQIHYASAADYDIKQEKLSPAERDGFIKRFITRGALVTKNVQKQDPEHYQEEFTNGFLHKLPQLLFVSLPVFALILQLLYTRQKQYYYTDHGIFSIHLYIFTFINLLVQFGIYRIAVLTHIMKLWYICLLLTLWIFMYLYKAMRNFYGQRRGKTILKFVLLNGAALVIMTILSLLYLTFNYFTIS